MDGDGWDIHLSLDGGRATTHWRHTARLRREYPAVRVQAD